MGSEASTNSSSGKLLEQHTLTNSGTTTWGEETVIICEEWEKLYVGILQLLSTASVYTYFVIWPTRRWFLFLRKANTMEHHTTAVIFPRGTVGTQFCGCCRCRWAFLFFLNEIAILLLIFRGKKCKWTKYMECGRYFTHLGSEVGVLPPNSKGFPRTEWWLAVPCRLGPPASDSCEKSNMFAV